MLVLNITNRICFPWRAGGVGSFAVEANNLNLCDCRLPDGKCFENLLLYEFSIKLFRILS